MEKNEKVSLGCGSLILIALIVLILGNADQDELRDQVKRLDDDVKRLESSIQLQSQEIRELKQALGDSRAGVESRPR
jgi:predicted nuclease with TOPRIM domain